MHSNSVEKFFLEGAPQEVLALEAIQFSRRGGPCASSEKASMTSSDAWMSASHAATPPAATMKAISAGLEIRVFQQNSIKAIVGADESHRRMGQNMRSIMRGK
jgi:hypothetical protein